MMNTMSTFEQAAMKALRDKGDYESTQNEDNVFTVDGTQYSVGPIPKWANHLHEQGIGVKYGAWGIKS